MMKRSAIPGALGISALLVAAAVAGPQDAQQSGDMLLARRAAEADAYRTMGDTISGLHITAGTLVGDFISENGSSEFQFGQFIRSLKPGEPKWHAKGRCTVPMEVAMTSIVKQLKQIHSGCEHRGAVQSDDFDRMAQLNELQVIQVVGMGTPRPDLPPDLPDGVKDMITQVPDLPDSAIPELWDQLGKQAQTFAHESGAEDARRRMIEEIKGLRISDGALVRDLVADWTGIDKELKPYLKGAVESYVYYHDDLPVVEVTYSIPIDSVVSLIEGLHQRHYQGSEVTVAQIGEMKRWFRGQTFTATGVGTPQVKHIRDASKTTEVPIPDWANLPVIATGRASSSSPQSTQDKVQAAHAAELAAKRTLVDQVHAMRISSDMTVAAFISRHPSPGAQLESVLMASYVDGTEWTDGGAVVTVRIPGMRIWTVLGRELSLQKAGG